MMTLKLIILMIGIEEDFQFEQRAEVLAHKIKKPRIEVITQYGVFVFCGFYAYANLEGFVGAIFKYCWSNFCFSLCIYILL